MSWQNKISTAIEDRDYKDAKGFIQVNNYKSLPEGARNIDSIIIHITGWIATTESGAVNRFLNQASNASAHYIVNREGEVLQMVRHKDIAKHAGGGVNKTSIGIEHVNQWHGAKEGYEAKYEHPTGTQYIASAKLVSWLCKKYSIPVKHVPSPEGAGIKGHAEANPNTNHKNCPNPAWNWEGYIKLVKLVSKPESCRELETRAAHANYTKLVNDGVIGVFTEGNDTERWDAAKKWKGAGSPSIKGKRVECWLTKF
jgi:N-acetylmuramoyl-L-alanine amidase